MLNFKCRLYHQIHDKPILSWILSLQASLGCAVMPEDRSVCRLSPTSRGRCWSTICRHSMQPSGSPASIRWDRRGEATCGHFIKPSSALILYRAWAVTCDRRIPSPYTVYLYTLICAGAFPPADQAARQHQPSRCGWNGGDQNESVHTTVKGSKQHTHCSTHFLHEQMIWMSDTHLFTFTFLNTLFPVALGEFMFPFLL